MSESRWRARLVDVLQVVGLLLVDLAEHALGEHFREADDRVERRAQLVRHVGEELRLVLVRHLELRALLLDLAEQPRVLDRDHRLVGEGLQERDLLLRKGAGHVSAKRDRADALALPEHRRKDDRAEARLFRVAPDDGRDVGIAEDIREMRHAPLQDRHSRARFPGQRNDGEQPGLAGLRAAARDDLDLTVFAHEPDAHEVALEKPLAAFQDLVEHRLRIGDRARDRAEHLRRRLLLLERLLGLVEQAHVLDADGRLVGKGLGERDLLVREGSHLRAAQQHRAEGPALAQQRRSEHGLVPAELARELPAHRIFRLRASRCHARGSLCPPRLPDPPVCLRCRPRSHCPSAPPDHRTRCGASYRLQGRRSRSTWSRKAASRARPPRRGSASRCPANPRSRAKSRSSPSAARAIPWSR